MPEHDDYLAIRRSGQLSNVACLISRDVFREHQFRGNYAEDLDLGIRLIKHGYEFVFLSSTKIIHSHNRTCYYYLKRGYVDELVISELFPERVVVRLEAEALYSDIVFTNNVVHSILHHELGRFSVPCSVEALSHVVRQRFHRARKDPYPASLALARNGYLDGEFRLFLEGVHRNNYVRPSDPRYRGTVLDELQGYTNVLFEYMNGTYETVDGTVLEEFKVALCKWFALVCGLGLGSCFFWGDEGVKGELKDINEELCKAV
jgi:hypothetical protein